jgi:protein-tyrosine phosphatase
VDVQPYDPSIDVLLVCTGNICRSPMAAAILHAHLAERGVDAHVHSAGTMAWGGPATGNAELAMQERGLALDGHLSRRLTDDLVVGADLVLGMTREHVWRAGLALPGAVRWCFIVGELARLGSEVGPRDVDREEGARSWAARVAATRGDGPIGRVGDAVDDPVGEPLAVYRATAARLDRDLSTIAALLAP